jgi:hypothetical protein
MIKLFVSFSCLAKGVQGFGNGIIDVESIPMSGDQLKALGKQVATSTPKVEDALILNWQIIEDKPAKDYDKLASLVAQLAAQVDFSGYLKHDNTMLHKAFNELTDYLKDNS